MVGFTPKITRSSWSADDISRTLGRRLSAVVQQSPCSPSASLHRSSIASSPIAAAMITSSLSHCLQLMHTATSPSATSWVQWLLSHFHLHTYSRGEGVVCFTSCIITNVLCDYDMLQIHSVASRGMLQTTLFEGHIQHIRVRVTSISHDRHIPIIARMDHSHDVWAQLHTDSDTSPQQCQHVV